jgi:hypothetical protein
MREGEWLIRIGIVKALDDVKRCLLPVNVDLQVAVAGD